MNVRLDRRLVLLTVAVAWLLGVGAAVAQEGPNPFAYFYLVESKVQQDKMSDYSQAVGQIVAANQKHTKGRAWAAFSNFTGEGTTFRYFLAMPSMSVMDSWVPMPQILAESLGGDAANSIMTTLGSTSMATTRLLAHDSSMSHMPTAIPEGSPPPAFVMYFRARVQGDSVAEYVSLVQKMVAAAKDQSGSPSWLAYSNSIGGKGNEFHVFVPMQKMGEFDSWVPPQQAMTAKYGAQEAAAMQQRMSEISEGAADILIYAPNMSNIPEM